MRESRRSPFIDVAIIATVLTAIGTVVVLSVPWLPEEASKQAGPMDTLYDVLAVISVVVFSVVMAVLTVSVSRYRRRFGDEGDGAPIHGHTGLEVVWTVIPAVLVTGAAIYSGVVLGDIEDPKPGTKTILATGQQFAWTFDYQGEGVRRAGQLHLVKDTPYLVNIRAKEVLHSFWVPEFRLKKDAVPGMTTHVRITPKKNGTFAVVCAELCGLGHATMRATVKVEDQASFDRWIAQQRRNQPPAAGAAASSGGGSS
jgi:cytochrome c oxidase subunit 2